MQSGGLLCDRESWAFVLESIGGNQGVAISQMNGLKDERARERATRTERAGASGARESVWGSPRGASPSGKNRGAFPVPLAAQADSRSRGH